MDIDTEEEFFPNRLPFVKGEPTIQEKSSVRPESWKVSALDIWAKTNLRPCLQRQLADSTGKHSPDKTVEGEIVFRHVLPYVLLRSAFFTETDMENLDQATPLPSSKIRKHQYFCSKGIWYVQRLQESGGL